MKRVNTPCIAADPWCASGRTIYYGDPGQDYVVLMNIVSTTKDGDDDMADKIVVQCMATDPTINPKDRIVKHAERDGLYPALQIASIWLDRNN